MSGYFETGVIFDFHKHDKDVVHVETCGPNNYILHVMDRQTPPESCMVCISRDTAEDLCRALLIHIEKTKMMLGDCD